MEDTTDALKLFGSKGGDDKKASGENVPVHVDGRTVKLEDLENPSAEYKMDHGKRGLCIIINQKDFLPQTGQGKRDGTDRDAENAERAFKKLGFKVKMYKDLRAREIIDVFKRAALDSNEEHADADCFATVILSHGQQDYIYGVDEMISINSFVRYFRGDCCKALFGKPKLFFIQACRGHQFDQGSVMHDGVGDEIQVQKIPVEADFLMAYSTVPGYYAWRSNQDGSWFINSLCKVFQKHGDKVEIMQMMTLIHRLVSYSFSSNTGDSRSHNMKQMPSSTSMLTKLLYFRSNN